MKTHLFAQTSQYPPWSPGPTGPAWLTTAQTLGSRIRMQAERSLAKSWQSSTIHNGCGTISAIPACIAVRSVMKRDVMKRTSPARQLVSPPADVSPMRVIRSNILRFVLASLLGLCGMAGAALRPARAAPVIPPPPAVPLLPHPPRHAAPAPTAPAGRPRPAHAPRAVPPPPPRHPPIGR